MKIVSEENQTLWLLTFAPAIWMAHFLVSYITASLWCRRFDTAGGPAGPLPELMAILTTIALGGIAVVGWSGWRRHTYGGHESEPPHDADTPEDRHRFLGFATVLLAGLSAVATIYVGVSVLLTGGCR
jgi:hypothetical protein